MVQANNKFSEKQQVEMLLQGIDYAMIIANLDKEKFELLDNKGINSSDQKTQSMIVLDILKRLGYPMNELGTYLYKDIIMEACHNLEVISLRELLSEELSDYYSDFYCYIANRRKNMDLEIFHYYIEKSIEKIDHNNIDEELVSSIYGEENDSINYGLNALKISEYVLSKQSLYKPLPKRTTMIRIRELNNSPKNVRKPKAI